MRGPARDPCAAPGRLAGRHRLLARLDQGNGSGARPEKRVVKAVTVTAGLAFPDAAQAIQVTRRTRRSGGRAWRKGGKPVRQLGA